QLATHNLAGSRMRRGGKGRGARVQVRLRRTRQAGRGSIAAAATCSNSLAASGRPGRHRT
ncbi:hypothetical protein RZS08_38720, partial [Arthrospira platensis SPKY1]|nr:hypothetical protein [Arthrospira platensis SPKY1]